MLYHKRYNAGPYYIGLVYCPPENREIDPSRVRGLHRVVPDLDNSIPWNIVTTNPFWYQYDNIKIFQGHPFEPMSVWEGGDDKELQNDSTEDGSFNLDQILETYSQEGIPFDIFP